MAEMATEEEEFLTKDGTVDYEGNPADKRKTGTWKACPYIIGNECCERLAYYGMSSNLVLYFKNRLNQSSATATKNNSDWSGTCYITPLLGAFLADAYLGRYWTIAGFSIIYILHQGMTLLTMSASMPGLRPACTAEDKCQSTDGQSAVFFVALYMIALGTIALGTGGIKPCVSSYGADQFDDADTVEKEHKASFFNWFYFSINVGALIASSVLVWVQDNVSWGWGLGIPAMAMAIAVVSFFSGTRKYRYQKPGGSPLTRICQVMVASFRKYRVSVPDDKSLLYEIADSESNISGYRKLDHTEDFRCLDKAAIKEAAIDPWRLCTVTQVEEFKAIIRLLPIWATGIVSAAMYSQMGNLFILQGDTMDKRLGHSKFKISAANVSVFDTLSVIFWIPIYDRIIVPAARKFTGHKNGFTQLQRMGIGLVISTFSMVCPAILELIRLRMVRKHNYYDLDSVPFSIFWQVPQYFLMGCAEVFTNIGQLEFFYEQAPDAMRSSCSALSLTTIALGSYLSSLLVTIVTGLTTRGGKPGWIPDNLNYGHVDYFFWLLAGLSFVNLVAFVVIARRYTYKKPVGTLR
ncbi:unnamed protein product [Linum tenue]|uniref:Peptide transporter 1 n=1 Tax=Linum tenue TaxID=586396 RepID=A0AAV0PWH1_9ROSI|nr:unnamed protein product [Linum tenue]